jgi:hypothetical protein
MCDYECVEGNIKIRYIFILFRCKTLVVIDGFNAFFHPRTRVVTAEKIQVSPPKITLTEAFVEITKYDWVSINLISQKFFFLTD